MTFLRKIPRKPRRVDVVRCGGHLAHVRKHHCIVPGCERIPTQAMHIEIPMNATKGRKAGDDRTVPGCAYHHTDGPLAYHKIGRDKFEEIHKVNFDQAIEEVNRDSKPLKRYLARMDHAPIGENDDVR